MKRIIAAMLMMAMLFTVLGGCFFASADELYSLPQPSKTYLQLQTAIDELTNAGAEFLAPVAGNNRESVQRIDLNGDGSTEAIACFTTQAKEKPLRICVFSLNSEHEYELSASITGEGTAIERIAYDDLDGDGWMEVIVGWKMSAELQTISVYSVKGFEISEQLSTQYSDMILFDINGDTLDELCCLYHNPADDCASLNSFGFKSGEYTQMSARLSVGALNVTRIKSGCIADMIPALFVTSTFEENGFITDVFACSEDELVNVTTRRGTSVSNERVTNSNVFETDINGDGVMEIPYLVSLPTNTEGTNYWMLKWRSYELNGRATRVMTTYHCYSDEWYYVIPDEWQGRITVRRVSNVSGMNTVVFSIWNGDDEPPTDFLRIYKLTGDNKEDRATLSGRFILKYRVDTIYAAQILLTEDEWKDAPTEEEVKAAFNLIYSEWVSGAV